MVVVVVVVVVNSCFEDLEGRMGLKRSDLGQGSGWAIQGHLSFCSLATPV